MDLFCEDVRVGLAASPKHLDSKYFYDEKGDALFRQIMASPEYYVTNCELEILSTQTDAIIQSCCKATETFNVIELGSGDGLKTKYLLEGLLQKNRDFVFVPIDISANALSIIEADFRIKLPTLRVKGLHGEYVDMLKKANAANGHQRNKLVLLLGSNIGNMRLGESLQFLQNVYHNLDQGDLLLTGFDLKKNPKIILAAYNDAGGITQAFNLNLLARINRELEGDFIPAQFEHFPTYDPVTGACKSYLISGREQDVEIKRCHASFHFAKDEAMLMEISQKFSIEMIHALAEQTGFQQVNAFFDRQRWFVDVLWQKR